MTHIPVYDKWLWRWSTWRQWGRQTACNGTCLYLGPLSHMVLWEEHP